MKTSTSCTCHSEPDLCGAGVLERPRYYPRQLLTPAEMTLEQQYFRDKLRRHNRLIHGWGVVCGATVCLVAEPAQPGKTRTTAPDRGHPAHAGDPARTEGATASRGEPQPWKVRITPGYVLGPYGDEILIEREHLVDLRTCGQSGVAGEHGEPPDPWCVDVYVQREPGPLYVAVRYQEVQSRPVRVQPAGCGCDDTQCEYSRWRDGYEICVLTDCPPSHENPPDRDDPFAGPLPDCPECPPDPWVVLARVEVDDDGTITALDNCSCRRLVVSFGASWWRCSGDACAIESVEVEGGGPVAAGSAFTLKVAAHGLPAAVEVDLGDGVTVESATVTDGSLLEVKARVAREATPGPRSLEVRDAATGRVVAARRAAFGVRSAGKRSPAREPGGSDGEPAPPPERDARDRSTPTPRGKRKGGGT